jgi:hypothetical protein
MALDFTDQSEPFEAPTAVKAGGLDFTDQSFAVDSDEGKLGFAERFGKDIDDRMKMADEIQKAAESGRVEEATAMAGMVGKVGGGLVLDFIGEAVTSAGHGLSAITPDFIEDPIVDTAKDAGIAFLNTDLGKAGMIALQEGMTQYGEWAEENPNGAMWLESMINIGMVAAPVKGKPKVAKTGKSVPSKVTVDIDYLGENISKKGLLIEKTGETSANVTGSKGKIRKWLIDNDYDMDLYPEVAITKVKPKGSLLKTKGEELTKKGVAQQVAEKKAYAQELVLPLKQTDTAKRTVVEGGTKRIIPTASEVAMAKEVGKLPLKKKTAFNAALQENYTTIYKEIGKEATKLKNTLKDTKIIFTKREVRAYLKETMDRIAKENFLITGDAAKSANKIFDKIDDLIEQHPSTPNGLLQVRKDLDQHIKDITKTASGKSSMFGDGRDTAAKIANGELRTALNDFLASKTPNVAVKKSLNKQSTLYRALDNIEPKADKEAAKAIQRLWGTALKVLPVKSEFAQVLALGFGIGGLGAASTFAPYFTKLALGGLITYKAGKAVMSAKTKKTLGILLQKTDEAIKIAKDKTLISRLRADRAILVGIINNAEIKESGK